MHNMLSVDPPQLYLRSKLVNSIPFGYLAIELSERDEYSFLVYILREIQLMPGYASLLSTDLPKMYLWSELEDY